MWYFWPDLAFDLVKGLVAGGASLALQVVAPADAARLEAVSRTLVCAESRKKGSPKHVSER